MFPLLSNLGERDAIEQEVGYFRGHRAVAGKLRQVYDEGLLLGYCSGSIFTSIFDARDLFLVLFFLG